MVELSPVDELVTGGRRHEQITRARARQRGPQTLERIGVIAAAHAAIGRVELERALVTIHRPAAAAQVAQVAARRETQLADSLAGVGRAGPHDALAALAPSDEVDAIRTGDHV